MEKEALGANAVHDISVCLNALLADMFGLYVKTKNFHWHVSGPHFRDYHLLLDDQGGQIFATTDVVAERIPKLGHFADSNYRLGLYFSSGILCRPGIDRKNG